MRLTPLLALAVVVGCAPEAPLDASGPPGGAGAVIDHTAGARVVNAPLLGGTVTSVAGGDFAIVSDPERDLVYVVEPRLRRVRATVRLPVGSQPTRAAEDRSGQAHVVLRGTGQLATIGISSGALIRTDSVCPEPRGVAWDGARDALVVACASGELVTLPTTGSSTVRRLDADLRDVIVRDGKVRVSTFRSAQLLDVAETPTPLAFPSISLPPVRNEPAAFEPSVAWRTVQGPGDLTVTVHQRSVGGDIDAIRSGLPPTTVPYYTNPCSTPIVRSVLSVANASRVLSSIEIEAVLPVDVAVAPDGSEVAVVGAGNSTVVRLPFDRAMGGVSGGVCGVVAPTPPPTDAQGRPSSRVGQPVGVAFVANGELLVHSRSPAQVVLFPGPGAPASAVPVTLRLEGADDVESPGFRLFHTAASGLACASCHPEGQEDGRVWTFFGRKRRTQSLAGGLSETAPFHWKGELPSVSSVLNDTFVARMGGQEPSMVEIASLTRFLDSLPAPRPPTRETPVDMVLGRAVFERSGCAGCHAGAKLTTAGNSNVGTGESFQIPSLRGLARRAPFMHDGCAKRMADRFDDVACGGRTHGDISGLSAPEREALIGYLGQL